MHKAFHPEAKLPATDLLCLWLPIFLELHCLHCTWIVVFTLFITSCMSELLSHSLVMSFTFSTPSFLPLTVKLLFQQIDLLDALLKGSYFSMPIWFFYHQQYSTSNDIVSSYLHWHETIAITRTVSQMLHFLLSFSVATSSCRQFFYISFSTHHRQIPKSPIKYHQPFSELLFFNSHVYFHTGSSFFQLIVN